MRRLAVLGSVAALTLATVATMGASAGAAREARSGYRVLVRADAAAFLLPADVDQVWTARLANGLRQTRYQQVVGRAAVLGGQLTLLQDRAGTTVAVIGSHYPGLTPTNTLALGPAQARTIAAARIGSAGRWLTRLLIDPRNGRLFYEVENRRFPQRWIQWIDATTGTVVRAFDAIAHGTGVGVKGDTKTLDTTLGDGAFELISGDGRQRTYDARNRRGASTQPGTLFVDADDVWDLGGSTSPGHAAGVDAHFYANLTDDFYLDVFGRDSLDAEGMAMVSTAHYGAKYNNAFWNGVQMVYGDGDGTSFTAFSGGLDVVGHELTHGVTEFTSDLIYAGESGALNEAFSDMMGTAIEFYADDNGLDPSVEPDFLISEDVSLVSDDAPGLRNMSDPREDADPDHYAELVITKQDNGGVHSNSGIPNHAFYLLAAGGSNAGCDAIGSNGHTHTEGCTVTVDAVGIDDATQIFFTAFTSLPENANMCSARQATLAAADVYESGAHLDSVADAWTAVGVADDCTPSQPPPSCDVEDATIPFASDRPYANDLTCTWTYDHGSPGFRLHFSRFSTEPGFDFVYVIEGDGTVLHELTGSYPSGLTTDCITTSTVDVQLVADPLISRPGFEVDAALAC